MKGMVGQLWNKIFMEIFRSMLHGILPFSPVSLTDLCSFWNGLKGLFTLHKSKDKVILTIKTDDHDVSSSRKDMDLHGRPQVAQRQMD